MKCVVCHQRFKAGDVVMRVGIMIDPSHAYRPGDDTLLAHHTCPRERR